MICGISKSSEVRRNMVAYIFQRAQLIVPQFSNQILYKPKEGWRPKRHSILMEDFCPLWVAQSQ